MQLRKSINPAVNKKKLQMLTVVTIKTRAKVRTTNKEKKLVCKKIGRLSLCLGRIVCQVKGRKFQPRCPLTFRMAFFRPQACVAFLHVQKCYTEG